MFIRRNIRTYTHPPPHTGYTHAARGELEEAEAAARLMLEIIDRHAAVLHLPLTFTLAEASRRLLKTAAERSARRPDPGLHSAALHGARATLVFARPGGGGGGAVAAGRGGGGWCAVGDGIMAAFDRVCGGDGEHASAEVRKEAFLFVENMGVMCLLCVDRDAWASDEVFNGSLLNGSLLCVYW